MAMAPDSKRVGELLIQEGIILAEELQRAVEESTEPIKAIAKVLTSCGHATRESLIPALTASFTIPHINLDEVELGPKHAELVPVDVATKHELVPLTKLGDILVVAKANYFNRAAVADLRRVTGGRVKVLQCEEAQINAALRKIYGPDAAPAPAAEAVAPAPAPSTASSFMGGPVGNEDALAATVVSELPNEPQTTVSPSPIPVARQPEPVEASLELQELPPVESGEPVELDPGDLLEVEPVAPPPPPPAKAEEKEEEVLELSGVIETKSTPPAEDVVDLSEVEEVKEAPAEAEPVLVPEPSDELQPVEEEAVLLEVPADDAQVLEEMPVLEEVQELAPEPVGPEAPAPYFEWPAWQAPPRPQGNKFKALVVQREEVAAVQLAYKLDIQTEWDKLYTSEQKLAAIRMAK